MEKLREEVSNAVTQTEVYLNYNSLDDSAVDELASLLSENINGNTVRSIESIQLASNHFGPDSFARLVKVMARMPALTSLNVGDNVLLDPGAESIAELLLESSTVTDIEATDCCFSSQGITELRMAVSGIERAVILRLEGNDEVEEEVLEEVMKFASVSRIPVPKAKRGGTGSKSPKPQESQAGKVGSSSSLEPAAAMRFATAQEERLHAQVEELMEKLRVEEEARHKAEEKSRSMVHAPIREINPEDITLGSKIGSGGFAKIFRGRWLGKEVAVKKLRETASSDVAEALKKEINLLASLRHPNVLLLLGSTVIDGNLAVVTELMTGGSLYSLIQKMKKRGTNLDGALFRQIAMDVAVGMCYLHECKPPVIHRDLKSMNILLDDHARAKVADFGLSRERSNDKTMTFGLGTPHWLAPEIARGEKYNEKVDVYSFAMLLWEMVTLEVPFSDLDVFALIGKIVNNKNFRPDIPDSIEENIASLIRECWDEDPAMRPSFKKIVMMFENNEI